MGGEIHVPLRLAPDPTNCQPYSLKVRPLGSRPAWTEPLKALACNPRFHPGVTDWEEPVSESALPNARAGPPYTWIVSLSMLKIIPADTP